MKIEFRNNGKKSILIITNPIFFLKRHADISIAAVNTAPNAAVHSKGFLVLRTILKGDTYEIWKASLRARKTAEKYCRMSSLK